MMCGWSLVSIGLLSLILSDATWYNYLVTPPGGAMAPPM